MDKKNFTPRGLPQASKLNHDSSKPDYTRKKGSQIQRRKELDKSEKIPSNRGRTGQRNVRSREKVGSQMNPSYWEVGSIHKSGSKKHRDITHQLVYPEYRPQHSQGNLNRGRRSKFSSNFSKEHYLQANCQFIVASGYNYSGYENNPDKLVDWSLIEEVWLHCADPPSCPICLYPPIAAKITKCGHIFCYSCILHYLALSDNKLRKCPLCQEYVQRDILRSMIVINRKEYAIGEEIEMHLMKRDKDSLTPVYVGPTTESASKPDCSFRRGSTDLKLIVADVDEIDKFIIKRELHELDVQKKTDGDVPESCFIDEALALLEARKLNLLKRSSVTISEQLNSLSLSDGTVARKTVKAKFGLGDTNLDNVGQDGKNAAKLSCYFYQATTGSYTYMHSINVQMLTKEFGSLENCPPTIKGTVVQKDSISMTLEYRQRFRYLKHLPLSCSVDIMELHFIEPVLSAATSAEFTQQIECREKKRKEKEKEANNIERRVRLKENEMFGGSDYYADIHLDSRAQFPDFSQEPAIASIADSEKEVDAAELPNTNWNMGSFAQMTKNYKKPEPEPHFTWPSLPTGSPSQLPADDNSYNVPDYSVTFSSAFLNSAASVAQPENNKTRRGKKKKMNILFSTGGQKK